MAIKSPAALANAALIIRKLKRRSRMVFSPLIENSIVRAPVPAEASDIHRMEGARLAAAMADLPMAGLTVLYAKWAANPPSGWRPE
jgi:hypothetical protein